jgi:choline kinase
LYADSKEGIFLLCSRADDVASDDIKIKFDDNNKVREASKSITDHDGVSAGLMIVIGGKSSAAFRRVLNEAARRDDFLNHNKTWHSFIKDLAGAGVEIEPLIVEKSEWAEVDIHFDLQQLRSLLESSLTKNKFNF